MIYRTWLLEHFTLFRLALFFCCFAYWVIGVHWFKPRGRELPAALLAVWVQFSLGTLLDIQITRRGYWVYRPMGFSLYGVPLDLHVDWGLIWGFFSVWLYSKLRRNGLSSRFVLLYLSVWTLLTLAFDAVIAPYLLFLAHVDRLWWLADLALLFMVQGVLLWVYQTSLYPPRLLYRVKWSCRLRSLLYVSSLAYVFYSYLPGIVLSRTNGWSARPLLGLGDGRVLIGALLPPLLLGTWATLTFTDVGLGTPLPGDPPRLLVTTGPYAFVRNPMQISGMLLAALLVLVHPTKFMALYVVDMALVSLVLFHLFECGELQQTFGDAYFHYRSHVRNWLPRLRPYHPHRSTR